MISHLFLLILFNFRIEMADETPQGPFTMEDIHDQLQDMNRYNPENQVRSSDIDI